MMSSLDLEEGSQRSNLTLAKDWLAMISCINNKGDLRPFHYDNPKLALKQG